jgi:hypothetical protein
VSHTIDFFNVLLSSLGMNYSLLRILVNFLVFQFIILFGVSCQAPRTNPLDPLNPDYKYGSIEGTVQTTGTPSFGIDKVKVIWEKANIITETDANGRFILDNIPIDDGKLIFSKSGYKPDTLNIQWGTSKRYFAQVFFNRIPVLDTISLYTIVRNRIILGSESELYVKAWVTDPDGDVRVDTVFIYNEVLNLKKPLEIVSVNGIYQTTIINSELDLEDIEQAIGLDFSIIYKDAFENEFNIGNERITRIIKSEVTGQHPSTDSIINFDSQPVIFKWDAFRPGFVFTYVIEVFTYTGLTNPQLIHTKSGIPPDSVTYSLSQDLSVGDYYWVIWIVDQFQNRSRSKQTLFRIRPDDPGIGFQ